MDLESIFPTNLTELKLSGSEAVDFVLVTGDTFIDHSSCGAAIIGRVLTANGYTVGVISQPDWHDNQSVQVLGRPGWAF